MRGATPIDWLEAGLVHADGVLAAIAEIRSGTTAALRFDADQIARAILRSLTPSLGPGPLVAAAEHEPSGDLRSYAEKAEEAWLAVRMATMDDQHGAAPAEEIYEPIIALQWYETALTNFAAAARSRLAR